MKTLKPVAKKNHAGKIVSSPSEIKSLLSKEYKERLRNRPLKPDYQHLKVLKSEIFQLKMKNAENNVSAPWKMSQLESAQSQLKNNKSREKIKETLFNKSFCLQNIIIYSKCYH